MRIPHKRNFRWYVARLIAKHKADCQTLQWNKQGPLNELRIISGGQSTQIKYLSKSTDTYSKILLQ